MACIKCGRDVQEGQVFCANCQEVMEYYPVKPGTAVQLPRPASSIPRKPAKRRAPSLEDQILVLKKRVRILTISLIFSLILVLLLAYPAYEHFFSDTILPGQNYSTITHPAAVSTIAAD